jgi:hypothetical protein
MGDSSSSRHLQPPRNTYVFKATCSFSAAAPDECLVIENSKQLTLIFLSVVTGLHTAVLSDRCLKVCRIVESYGSQI